jgi:hypothetical protein
MPNRRNFIALAAAAAAVFTAPAFALGSLVDVTIVDRARSETLPTWSHRGEAWVAGRPGERYAVRLANRSGARVLVVLSIDGVNAVSGETAATGQTGYVLGPWQTTEITGWRKNLTEASAFYFTALPDSYAARTDRPDNVGVIGAAVFREKEREFVRPPSAPVLRGEADQGSSAGRLRESDSAARAAPSAAAPAPESKAAAARDERADRPERLGTGHGEREYAPTTQTTFDRAGERPSEVVRVRYDSRENLVALGVIRTPRAPQRPDPFPAFVPDPKG